VVSGSVDFDTTKQIVITVENTEADTDHARPSHVLGSIREALLRVV
jgi:hypothetical protein